MELPPSYRLSRGVFLGDILVIGFPGTGFLLSAFVLLQADGKTAWTGITSRRVGSPFFFRFRQV